MQTRRDLLAVAAATVTLPMLDSALGTLRSAQAAAPAAGGAPAPAGGAGRGPAPEKPGWFATTLKPADVKDDQFTAIADHNIVLASKDKKISALTNVCTHRSCIIKPVAGSKTLDCTCHKSSFNLDGSVAKAPATKPLDHYAIRLGDKGLIEVDPGTKPAADAKEFAIPAA